MGNNRDRLIVTALIWVMFTVLMGTFLSSPVGPANGMADEFVLGIVIALSVAVAAPTITMWSNRGDAQAAPSRAAEDRQSRKAKREQATRLQNLIERLDEDEIVELETLLQSRDDEAFRQR